MIEPDRVQGLMIEAAIEALIRLRVPGIASSEIQERGSMEIYPGYYYLLLDDVRVCRIDLPSKTQFEVTIL